MNKVLISINFLIKFKEKARFLVFLSERLYFGLVASLVPIDTRVVDGGRLHFPILLNKKWAGSRRRPDNPYPTHSSPSTNSHALRVVIARWRGFMLM